MELEGKVAVVTGGANGIGLALCRRFAGEGARAVVVADIDFENATSLAEEIGGVAVRTDVTSEPDMFRLIDQATTTFGHVDLMCLNAGIAVEGGVEVANPDWQRIWEVNVMSHVFGARAVLPSMIERRSGYLMHTASAAGLLTNIGAAPYAVTKHAAVALAEWLAITYADAGIKVSCLCPMGVKTDMLASARGGVAEMLGMNAVEPGAVADAVVEGLRDERFLILPQPEAGEMFAKKAAKFDRWIAGMTRLQTIVDDGNARAGVQPPSRAHARRDGSGP